MFHKETSVAKRTVSQRARGWGLPMNDRMRLEPHSSQEGHEKMDLGSVKRTRLTGFSSVVNGGEEKKELGLRQEASQAFPSFSL